MGIANRKILHTDILIIGGGTAGCYAALTVREHSDYSIIIAEKANIKRSGCLAAGVNAINAYIVKGRKPEDYVDYCRTDADGIVREDLLLSMSQGLNRVTDKMEKLGLVILKDENGEYVARGNRNIKINGENMKPLLAKAVEELDNCQILNRVNITDYIVENNQILGAFGFSIEDNTAYEIRAKKVLCATGGAAGLYRPNNPGFSRHKMWYPPFNTGAGYAMGINAGAEMTTFEMRFIALRCKDTIAPTGTIAQGVGAKQVNSLGEVYENKYGLTTSQRVYGTVRENIEGRGPCYLRTEGITPEQDDSLKRAYLNMAPSQTLKWLESGKNPSEQNVEIEGTEPYIVGGHTASGYWVDNETDFFSAPASTRFHGACDGGLCMHSLNVYHALHDGFFTEGESEESYAICALLHDLCKANYYKKGTRNVKNDATGQWEKVPSYSVEDLFPYGHGEKSVFLIERFMKLKVEEAVAIRWHMGGFDDAAKGGCFAISEAYDKYPLAVKLHIADLKATYLMEHRTSAVR